VRATTIIAILAAVTAAAIAAAEELSLDRYEVEGRKSGYLFLSESTRALQDDDFQNPGMFAVEHGRELWNRAEGPDGRSCASCHGDAGQSMHGVAAHYPKVDAEGGRLMNLELRINAERTRRMNAPALVYESADMLALTAFITAQSHGEPMDVAIDGPAQPFFEKGKEFYYTRRGQLDLACNQCHDGLVGVKLRGDVMSQGQENGFPIYRLSWRSMASRHRIFIWCNTSVRSEPYALGSEEYLNLELYLAWHGRGLPIEAPAVRR
jgi:L-cysteine S-thiosulfotransferase